MKTSKQKKSAQAADTSGKPTVISLFAGTGGSSLGYKWAGFRELLAVDFDPHAVECFRLNFPDVPVWQRSVVEVTGKEILEFCKIKKGELDVLDGSPPCQGFSTAGKRNVTDPRNDLFKHYVRLINELQPKVFVMENVSGMAKGKMKGRFIEIMKALKETGYNVKAKQMNAANYGVPQSRERIIFIGCKNGDPEFPKKIHKKIVSCEEALNGVKIGALPKMTPLSIKIWNATKPGENGTKVRKNYYFNAVKLNPHKPAPTLPKVLSGYGGFFHWREKRKLSIPELFRLCSFPDDWKLTGSITQQWARLGNAVMPKFMQAIAEQIKKIL